MSPATSGWRRLHPASLITRMLTPEGFRVVDGGLVHTASRAKIQIPIFIPQCHETPFCTKRFDDFIHDAVQDFIQIKR